MPEQIFSASQQGASPQAERCARAVLRLRWLVVCLHTASTEQFCKPPMRYPGTEICKLSGELPKAAVLNIFRLILFFTVAAGSPICIHAHTCPIPLHLKDQPSSRLWWPLGSNAEQLRPWGQLHISLLLSAWVIEATSFNCFLQFVLE